jgi:hypothetical protein
MCVSLSTIFCVKGVSVIMYCPCPINVVYIYVYMGGKGRRDVTHRSYNEYTRRVHADHHINIHLFTCPYSFTMCISNNRLSCEYKARKKEGNKASMRAWFVYKEKMSLCLRRNAHFILSFLLWNITKSVRYSLRKNEYERRKFK